VTARRGTMITMGSIMGTARVGRRGKLSITEKPGRFRSEPNLCGFQNQPECEQPDVRGT